MPFGKKKDMDGREVDFDRVYKDLIQEAVAGIAGLFCHRADDMEKPGWVHEDMLRHIFEDAVAVVDTSTLNANVFYELGVRHALRKSVTLLIHRKGTSWPFNIAGMNSIEYTLTPRGIEAARNKVQLFIRNALREPESVDSLVYHAVPGLRVDRGPARVPKRLTKEEVFRFPLARNPRKQIALISGDRERIRVADVWVNSENTEMQMDRYYGESTSATIRYLGAGKHPVTGRVREDTIGVALARAMGDEKQVEPGKVIATEAGELAKNGVKLVFHAASVIGQPREGYRPIERIERCVTNALALAGEERFREYRLQSILFPILGTGPAGGNFEDHARRLIDAAIEYLESNRDSPLKTVYFYVWTDVALEISQRIAGVHPGLKRH